MGSHIFSQDPKIKLLSIKEFFIETDFLTGDCPFKWNAKRRPLCGEFYNITSRYLIKLKYSRVSCFYGTEKTDVLKNLYVAFRDGKTEYDILDSEIDSLLKQNKNHSKTIGYRIQDLKKTRLLLSRIKFAEAPLPIIKPFESRIINTGYKTAIDELKGKYVVIDVETNGIRKVNDDLLSISIYDPTTGLCYNRLLPLDLQPMVLNSWIHGIVDEDIMQEGHLTQNEINNIIDFFDLKNKTILSFSGGKGTFDPSFIINYCKRHRLVGFENLCFKNIKSLIPAPNFNLEGQLTKDNLCILFNIDGVQEKHSSLNDCLLEWKLFEKINQQPLFFIDNKLYKFNKKYIVPVTYLNIPNLIEFGNLTVPMLTGTANCIFSYEIPHKYLNKLKKFPTNITGVALEKIISSSLNVDVQNNREFYIENKKQLDYIGSVKSIINVIPIEVEEQGTLKSLNPKFDHFIEQVNQVSLLMKECLLSTFEFIKNNIFKSNKILGQEIVFSPDKKIFATCDLSDSESILEIKTYGITSQDSTIKPSLARQLYYQSNGRKAFVLSIEFDTHLNKKNDTITDAIFTRIYQVDIHATFNEST